MVDTNKAPSLIFTGFSTPEGFASKTLATENRVIPAPIVRELIQNSLDAGQLASCKQIRVRFVFEELATEELPGIEEYRKAFNAARKTHEGHLESAQAQVSRIEGSLKSKTVKVLNVIDNGIGLDSERMNSLLGDGTTSKSEQDSAGSYGLGHFTAFPASNLHFILYGGVTKNSERTASAHAILASHEIEGNLRGKDGFLIKGARPTVRNRYIFPSNGEIPPFIDLQLDSIEKEGGSGSVVSIVAFNDFLEDEDSSAEAIVSVAAKHFFPSIRSGLLVVSVERNSGTKILDRRSLLSIIGKNTKNTRSGDPFSNSKAWSAYQTIMDSEKRVVKTNYGDIFVHIRHSAQERTRINLFRSGMWITDSLPRNGQGNYSGYKPFNALVLVDPPSEAFNLVRKSEGEKHLEVDSKRLADEDRRNFNNFFEEVREGIKEGLEEFEAEIFSPANFMLIEPDGEGIKGPRKRRSNQNDNLRNSIPLIEEVEESISSLREEEDGEEYDLEEGEETHTSRKNRRNLEYTEEPGNNPTFARSGKEAEVLTVARVEDSRVILTIRGNKDIENAGVRLVLDSGTDASCEKPIKDRFIQFKKEALVNGQPQEDSSYKEVNGRVFELQIGPIGKNQNKTVAIPTQNRLSSDTVIKVSVVNRPKEEKS